MQILLHLTSLSLRQAFVATGFNIIMNFDTSTHFNPAHRQCDFDREVGKVSLLIPFSGRALFPFHWADNPALPRLVLASNIKEGQWRRVSKLSPLLLFYNTHPPRCCCSACPPLLPTKLFLTKLAAAVSPPLPSQPASQAEPNYC